MNEEKILCLADKKDLTAIADEIRELSGTTKAMGLDAMAESIQAIPRQSAQTIVPTVVDQTIASGQYLTGTQIIKGDANLVSKNIVSGTSIFGVDGSADVDVALPTLTNAGTANDLLLNKQLIDGDGNIVEGTIPTKTSSDLTANGATVNVPAGYYDSQASKSVATTTQATPSVSVDSAGKITATATQTAGYVSAGTTSSTKQLTTQAAKTITPSKSSQTAVAKDVYTTGAVTVAAIPSQYITTTDATAEAAEIFLNESAYVNGKKITGTFTIDNELTTLNTLIPQLQEIVEELPEAGGVELPTLNNPAGATEILEGYEAIDEEGNIMIGTHTCASNGDIDASNFGYFCINVFSPYDPETLMFKKFLAFKLGMTWKEFYNSLSSFFGNENNIYAYNEIYDDSEEGDGSGPFRFYFYDIGIFYFNYQYIYNSNNELVQGTDVIQPFNFDTESPVYIANYF